MFIYITGISILLISCTRGIGFRQKSTFFDATHLLLLFLVCVINFDKYMHWNLMQCVIMANTIWYYSLLLLFWDNLISRFLKRGKKLSRAVSRKGKWHPFLRDQLRRPSPTLSLLQLILSFNLFVIGPEYFNLAVHQIMINIVELSLCHEIIFM